MKTSIRACSVTLREILRQALAGDADLGALFDPGLGGTMVVGLDTPQEFADNSLEGVSLWLYRLQRDDLTLNRPRPRSSFERLEQRPLPLRLHYLVAPIVDRSTRPRAAELEQHILGKVLQVLNDIGSLSGGQLRDDLAGQSLELFVRLEPLTLEETTRVWDALELSYQLCVSYEVSVVPIASAVPSQRYGVVDSATTEHGVAQILETP